MEKFWCIYVPRGTVIYFLFANILAMFLYPGGNHLELDQVGYSLNKNFLSELGFHYTMSGDVNFFSSFFFNSAMYVCLLQGIAYLFIPKLFKKNNLAYLFAWIGSILIFISNVFFVGVGLTPADLFFDEHIFFVLTAFNVSTIAIFFLMLSFIFAPISNYYTAGAFILFVFIGLYAFYISDVPQINPIEDRELFVETISMEFLKMNVVIQKFIVLSMLTSIFIFSFGHEKLLNEGQ